MSTEHNVKLVKDTMEAFMRTGSPEALLAAIAEDAVIRAVIPDGTPISKVLAFADMTAIVEAYRTGE
jgi:hypothetical protein